MARVPRGLGPGAKALFHLSRFLGVAPFRLTRSGASASRAWEVYSLLLITGAVAMINYMSYNFYTFLTGSFYHDLIGMTYILKGTCGCCLFVVGLARRRPVLRALNSVVHYAGSRRDLGRGCGEVGVVVAQMLALTAICIWTFVLSLPFYVNQTAFQMVYTLISAYLPHLVLIVTDMQYANLALLIHRQLSDLSGSARQLLLLALETSNNSEVGTLIGGVAYSPGLAQMTRLLRARQECIYSSIMKLNSAYSLQLLISVTTSLAETTCDLYFVITSQYWSWKPLLAAWACVYFSKMVLLMTVCQWVESEGEVISDTVNSALQLRNLAKADREELEEFQVQMVHLKMRFSAGGVFRLDYSQLQKVTSSITTYLVILLQMQGGPRGSIAN